jgi:hypothetical protein
MKRAVNCTFLILFLFTSNSLMSQSLKEADLIRLAFENDGYSDTILFNKAEAIYLESTKIDSTTFNAIKGLAMLYGGVIKYYEEFFDNYKKSLSRNEKKKIKMTISEYIRRSKKIALLMPDRVPLY